MAKPWPARCRATPNSPDLPLAREPVAASPLEITALEGFHVVHRAHRCRARSADSSHSQKELRGVLILAVDPLHPPRQSALDHLSEAVQAFTHAGKDDDRSLFNFREATGGRATLMMDGSPAYHRSAGVGKRAVSYRSVEPEVNQDGSVGCVQMDDAAWPGQWMVSRPENSSR